MIALALIWTLTMQGSLGLVTFGPYADFKHCRAAGLARLAKHDAFKWSKATCYSSNAQIIAVKKAKR